MWHLVFYVLGYLILIIVLLSSFYLSLNSLSKFLFPLVFLVTLIATLVFALLALKPIVFVPLQFLPSIIISRITNNNSLRENFFLMKKNPSSLSRVSIPTIDGKAVLDGVVFLYSSDEKPKWIVWLNANGVTYEQNLDFLEAYAKGVNCNVLGFNYRGVGESQGWPIVAKDLGIDAQSAVQFIIEKYSTSEEMIVVHGHSIGGGALVEVKKAFPKAHLVNDRSFRSLSSVVKRMMDETPMGAVMGYVISLISLFLLRNLLLFSGDRLMSLYGLKPLTFTYTVFIGLALGYLLSSLRFMGTVSYWMLQLWGWEVDVASAWKNPENDLILYHPKDGMISYPTSLHSALFAIIPSLHSFELQETQDPGFNHMYPLNYSKLEWSKICDKIRKLFK